MPTDLEGVSWRCRRPGTASGEVAEPSVRGRGRKSCGRDPEQGIWEDREAQDSGLGAKCQELYKLSGVEVSEE